MRRPHKRATCFAAVLWLANVAIWPALSPRQSSAPNPTAGCAVEQVTLRAADGPLLNGILYRPAAHPRPTALLLVHGFGANFYEAYFPSLARAAAKDGYATLALNMRDHDAGPKVSDFADNEADIAAGLAFLRKLGYSRLVLIGQSMGTNRVLYFQAVARDPGIVATVLVSGPGNLFEWNVWQFGREKAQALVEQALAMQAAGQERELMVVDLGPLGKALYTPRYLLSLRGPKAGSDPYQNIRNVANPILIIQGAADKLVEPGVAERLRKAATSSSKVDLVYMDGADHTFTRQEDVLVQRILGWLRQTAP